MSHLYPYSNLGVESVVDVAQSFLNSLSTHVSTPCSVNVSGTVFPLQAFTRIGDELFFLPPRKTLLKLYPLSFAALRGLNAVVSSIFSVSERDTRLQADLDDALFLSLYFRQRGTAELLLGLGANPGRQSSSNGLHAAARQGLQEEIRRYVTEFKAELDVEDKFCATPVIYAMQLEEPHDWNTIKLLFELGADPVAIFGDGSRTYAGLARAMRKWELAERLDGAIRASSSRASSCTIDSN